jgi:hypothetical protein
VLTKVLGKCYDCVYIKKVKVILVQALRLCTGCTTHRGSKGIVLLFRDHGTRREWGVSVTPRPLFTLGKTQYPLYRRLGGPQGQSAQMWKISPLPGFDPRTVQPVAGRYTDYATQPTWLCLYMMPNVWSIRNNIILPIPVLITFL